MKAHGPYSENATPDWRRECGEKSPIYNEAVIYIEAQNLAYRGPVESRPYCGIYRNIFYISDVTNL